MKNYISQHFDVLVQSSTTFSQVLLVAVLEYFEQLITSVSL